MAAPDESVEFPRPAPVIATIGAAQGVSALKVIGAVATLLGIIAAVLALSNSALSSHEAGTHERQVSKDVYTAHEKQADERYERIEKKLDQQDKKLDAHSDTLTKILVEVKK